MHVVIYLQYYWGETDYHVLFFSFYVFSTSWFAKHDTSSRCYATMSPYVQSGGAQF